MWLSLMWKNPEHQMSVLATEIQIFHGIAEKLEITETIV